MDRSVATLTTEQLYRKRAFDRVNQRASRARKKSRITELEEEVANLKQRLASSEDQVSSLRSSEAALREVISAARSSLQRIDSTTSKQVSIPSPPASTKTSESITDEPPSPLKDGSTSNALYPPEPARNSAVLPIRNDSPPTPEPTTTGDITSLALRDEATGFTLDLPFTQDFDSMFHFDGFGTDLNTNNPLSLSFLGTFTPDIDGNSWASVADLPVSDLQEPQELPQWERLPLHVEPMCRLDEVLLGQAQATRERVKTSGPIPELSGQAFPAISSLLNPDTGTDLTPVSNAIGVHGRVTMEIPFLPAKIAMMYNMCLFLRWLISPTKRNFEALPEYLRPLEIQLTTPHPVWIDLVIWPESRERIIKYMDWTKFPTMRAISNKTISINWPHGHSKVFTKVSQKELRLDPLFENHIRSIQNWTSGKEMSDEFPFLKGSRPEYET